MKKRKWTLIALAGALMLVAGGCQKEKDEAPVVTVQPVLGEDVAGYAGFSHLQAYTLGETAQNSVLYLPADENAYVGETCIISKTEGVEVTLNYAPMLGDEMINKPIEKKLQYTLDMEFSDTYAEEYENLDISKVEAIGNDAVAAEVSYLEYQDENKSYTANWMDYIYLELEDDREFKIVIKVDSVSETEQTAAVIEELEKYFGLEIPYESGALQAKLERHEPDDDTQLKMDANTVSFAGFSLYFPQGWEEAVLKELLITDQMMKEAKIDDVIYFSPQDSDIASETAIFLASGASDINSGEFGILNKEEEKLFERTLEEEFCKEYDTTDLELRILGKTELGWVVTVDFNNWHEFAARVYYIYRGDRRYMVMGIIEAGADDELKTELYDAVDQIYSTMEVK